MLLFKFFQESGPQPDTYYLSEIVSFSDVLLGKMLYFVSLSEGVGFLNFDPTDTLQSLVENVSFSSADGIYLFENLSERISFSDVMYSPLWIPLNEGVSFDSDFSGKMHYSVTLEEAFGLVSVSYGFMRTDYQITWRTRTRLPTFGHGGAEYGNIVSYGDGTAEDLDSFKIEFYNSVSLDLLRTTDITIVDTDNPDDSALFVYTTAMNEADNSGQFNPNLLVKIYQIGTDTLISPASQILITPLEMY